MATFDSATNDPTDVQILYHDGPCIVVNKPAGIATQAPRGFVGLEDLVKDYLRDREEKTGNIYLGVPHRLDRPVSGAIVFARHVRAARRLSEQFQQRLVRKIYWALVENRSDNNPLLSHDSTFDACEGIWNDFLRKIPGKAAAEVVDSTHPEGKTASLIFRRKKVLPGDTMRSVRSLIANVQLLEIELQTGRTHQIRVQAASRGLPIVGDTQYGSQLSFGKPVDNPRERAIGLHARRLEFEHPKTQEVVRIEAPLPPTWNDFLVG